jgi:putative endonuclease
MTLACHFEHSEKSAKGLILCSVKFYVYITTNPNQDTLYVGMTNNLKQRIIEHYLNRGKPETHAGKYYCYNLVFYEEYQYVNAAIARKKKLKNGEGKRKKHSLIHLILNAIT